MKKQTQKIEWKNAVAIIAGAPIEAVKASDPEALPELWRGVLYTGEPFTGHWYWGTVYLDVSGFAPKRQDLNALMEHDRARVVGSTTKLAKASGEIRVEGKFLMGDMEEEPDANTVRRRLSQGHPYQMSGVWQPAKVEQVPAGAQAKVNGKTVDGPCAIFRSFGIAEASFVSVGWDGMTAAVAAGENAGAVNVQIEGTNMDNNTTPTPTPPAEPTTAPAPVPLLTALKDAFGADRAIELVSGKPDGKVLADFAGELVTALQSARTELAAALKADGEKATKIAELEAALKAAKACPPVVTMNTDPSAPAGKPVEGPEAWKTEFAASKKLQDEFGSDAAYVLHREREAKAKAKQ